MSIDLSSEEGVGLNGGVEEGLAMESFAEGLLDKIVSVLSIDLVSLAFCRELVEDNVLDRVFRGVVLVGVGIRP